MPVYTGDDGNRETRFRQGLSQYPRSAVKTAGTVFDKVSKKTDVPREKELMKKGRQAARKTKELFDSLDPVSKAVIAALILIILCMVSLLNSPGLLVSGENTLVNPDSYQDRYYETVKNVQNRFSSYFDPVYDDSLTRLKEYLRSNCSDGDCSDVSVVVTPEKDTTLVSTMFINRWLAVNAVIQNFYSDYSDMDDDAVMSFLDTDFYRKVDSLLPAAFQASGIDASGLGYYYRLKEIGSSGINTFTPPPEFGDGDDDWIKPSDPVPAPVPVPSPEPDPEPVYEKIWYGSVRISINADISGFMKDELDDVYEKMIRDGDAKDRKEAEEIFERQVSDMLYSIESDLGFYETVTGSLDDWKDESLFLPGGTPEAENLWQTAFVTAGGNPFWKAALQGGWDPRQCTTFCWYRFYSVYGYASGAYGNGGTNAHEIAAAHPDAFEISYSPAPGAVFSTWGTNSAYGHTGFIEAVDEKYIWASDGNVNRHGIRLNYRYTYEEFIRTFGSGTVFAVPKKR